MNEELNNLYQDNQVYAKYLKKKCLEESAGCGECNDGCGEGCEEKCSCCPAGLVAVYEADGTHKGCLTPADAELFHKETFTCQSGYVKLYKEGTPSVFLGCVSESEFAELYAAVNPLT
jgi:hypothetical protein